MEQAEKVKAIALSAKNRVIEKTKELTENAAIKRQIQSCEAVISKNLLEIGKKVYAQYGEDKEASVMPDTFEKQCTAISNAKKAIADLKKELK